MRGLITLLFAAGFAASCVPEDDRPTFDSSQCSQAAGTLEVTGTWLLTGEMSRELCGDDLLNSDYITFQAPQLMIEQAVDGTLSLTPLSQRPDGVTFELAPESKVNGGCVTLKAIETDRRGATPAVVEWTFEGERGTDGQLTGLATVDGPGSCRGSGRFTLDILPKR